MIYIIFNMLIFHLDKKDKNKTSKNIIRKFYQISYHQMLNKLLLGAGKILWQKWNK